MTKGVNEPTDENHLSRGFREQLLRSRWPNAVDSPKSESGRKAVDSSSDAPNDSQIEK